MGETKELSKVKGHQGQDGRSEQVILRYKLNYAWCNKTNSWGCSGNCGTATQSLSVQDVDQSSDWCQREGIVTRLVPNNSPLQLVLSSSSWPTNINKIISWRAVTNVELRNRSDNNKPNTSPQTTILPAIRVPSNCQRNINLLAFDPDGDEVKCRYGNDSLSECRPCTAPSVLSLSSSCTLSFSPTTTSINETLYAVQMMMEEFPKQTINLTHTNGSQEVKTTNDAISKIPVQFLLKVVPSIPSCTEGLYLPRFLPPTPDNRAQIYTVVSQTVEIPIVAEATQSTITELLFSGPNNVVKSTSGSGNFALKWTPSNRESGQSHSICFVVQAKSVSSHINITFKMYRNNHVLLLQPK
ncbi:uncharacterized protein LOC119617236 [Kryptolebias marmoratus]|uniref:uncharacterized protein LOC119617236 n=1 Tax=Kryptolebias marmoratus TaxID=37003 RepID=UPI0018ACAEE6|nr:uncharacterized protein LOC119617236 [Kryptolebias marmoratus]